MGYSNLCFAKIGVKTKTPTPAIRRRWARIFKTWTTRPK